LIVWCGLVGWLWFAKPRAGLPFVLCLLLLAPTTLVPIISEVGAERRMYLPSLALISAMLVCAWQVIPRKVLIVTSALLIGTLAVTSVQRNAEYSSTYEMWRTVVDRRPHGRAHLNLAVAANDPGRSCRCCVRRLSTFRMLNIRLANGFTRNDVMRKRSRTSRHSCA